MNVVVAIDSFKGSVSSKVAGDAVRRGVQNACPDATVTVCPIADGGEGTLGALLSAVGGTKRTVTACDPLGRRRLCEYGVMSDGVTAVIETAQATGLPLLGEEERDPMHTTSYGVGELLLHAAHDGCRRLILGLGGSATNDGGIGMLEALGARFLDADGHPVPHGAKGLGKLASMDLSNFTTALDGVEVLVACDVTNPLCGENGCSAVFAPQKGASPADIPRMDAWLSAYATLCKAHLPLADPDAPGVGAAGGLGFACRTFLGAALLPGIELLIRETKLDAAIQHADLVITGEGRLDGQSMMGKAPMGIAAAAARHHVPVIALAGCVSPDATRCNDCGLTAFFPVLQTVCTLEEAMCEQTATDNIARTAEQAVRLFCAGRAYENHNHH